MPECKILCLYNSCITYLSNVLCLAMMFFLKWHTSPQPSYFHNMKGITSKAQKLVPSVSSLILAKLKDPPAAAAGLEVLFMPFVPAIPRHSIVWICMVTYYLNASPTGWVYRTNPNAKRPTRPQTPKKPTLSPGGQSSGEKGRNAALSICPKVTSSALDTLGDEVRRTPPSEKLGQKSIG